jgi:membrane protease YdiL (CAAX protease family)
MLVGVWAWTRRLGGPVARFIVEHSRLRREMPFLSALLVVRMGLYGVPGLVAYATLGLLYPRGVIPIQLTLGGLLGGVVLGLGFAAVGTVLAQAVALVNAWASSRSTADAYADLERLGHSGWMRGYGIARERWRMFGYALSALTIAGEELAFRGVALPLLAAGVGDWAAVVLTTVLFVAMQTTNMPSFRSAAIPMSSAVVIGVIQSVLALRTADMLPLLVAHYSFFVLVLLFVSLPRRRAARPAGATARMA